MKGDTGSPGLKGEKGEPGSGYYDPRYGGSGFPGQPGPPVIPCPYLWWMCFLEKLLSYFCIFRALKATPSLAHQDLKDHLVSQAEATMDGQDPQGHLDHLDLREDHTLETPGTQGVSWNHTYTQMSKMAWR